MSLVTIGKLFIALGLCYQAYLLFEDKTTASNFDKKLKTCFQTCNMIPPEIKDLALAHLRLVVVAFLGFSSLMVIFRSCLVKFPVLLGLVINFLVKYWPIKSVPQYKDT